MSVPYRRPSRLRSFFLALVAGFVVAIGAAAPASAGLLQVVPSISGSGSVTGGTPCSSAASVPNNTLTACPASFSGAPASPSAPAGVPGVINLTANPQGSPAGHWTFTRWEGCPAPSANVCQLFDFGTTGTVFTPRAVFTDGLGPAISQPTVSYSTTTDRTVTLSWSANEPVTSFACGVDGADKFSACPNGVQTLDAR